VERRKYYLRGWFFLAFLAYGGCTGVQEPVTPPAHAFDKTEVDLELGRPEAAARYQRPRGAQHYTSDATEVDLAQPRPAAPAEDTRSGVPATTPVSPKAPLPGGDR
jgi:hypothetical protein